MVSAACARCRPSTTMYLHPCVAVDSECEWEYYGIMNITGIECSGSRIRMPARDVICVGGYVHIVDGRGGLELWGVRYRAGKVVKESWMPKWMVKHLHAWVHFEAVRTDSWREVGHVKGYIERWFTARNADGYFTGARRMEHLQRPTHWVFLRPLPSTVRITSFSFES